jgi:hypothetical protein
VQPNLTWGTETATWADRGTPTDQWGLATLELTDVVLVSLEEASALLGDDLSQIVASDILIVGISEAAGEISVDLAASDTLGIQLQEESGVSVLCDVLDSLGISLSEVSSIDASVDVADTLGVSVVEDIPTLLSVLSTFDTLGILLEEYATSSFEGSTSDSLTFGLVETSSLSILVGVGAIGGADTLKVGLSETFQRCIDDWPQESSATAGWKLGTASAQAWNPQSSAVLFWDKESSLTTPPEGCNT